MTKRLIPFLILSFAGTAMSAEAVKPVETKKEDSVSTKKAAANAITIDLNQTEDTKSGKKLSASLSSTFATDTQTINSDDKGLSSEFGLGLSYKINKRFTAAFSTAVTKDLADSYEEKLTDSYLSMSHSSIELPKEITASPSIGLIIPTSQTSKFRDQMNTSLRVSNSFGYKLNNEIAFSLTLGGLANFYKYETNKLGANLTQYGTVQRYGVSYSITEKLGLSSSFTRADKWNHNGVQLDPAVSTAFSASYTLTSNIGLSGGISTGGSLYNTERGPDQNIELYDENATSYSATLGITY